MGENKSYFKVHYIFIDINKKIKGNKWYTNIAIDMIKF